MQKYGHRIKNKMWKQRRTSREEGIQAQSKQDFKTKEVSGSENGHGEMKFDKHSKMFH